VSHIHQIARVLTFEQVVYERQHGKDHFLDTAADYENEPLYAFLAKHL
jgi:hypothetical protein